MVPGERALLGYGHHERRYSSRGCHCSAVHRRSTIDGHLAVGIFSCGRGGLAWSVWWWRDYRNLASPAEPADTAQTSWFHLFSFPQVWGLVWAKFLSDAAWYFYLFWLPKYLYDARGFDVKRVGYFAWIPYAAAGMGSLLGGWFSGC